MDVKHYKRDGGNYCPSLIKRLSTGAVLLCISALLCQQGSYAAGTTIHPLYPSDFATRTHMKPKPIQHFGFDGQLTDSRSQWQFLGKGYRAYNPMLHRFMAQDSMSPFDKGGLNGYVFARNNPIMAFDPSGHSVASDIEAFIPHTWAGVGGLVAGLLIDGGFNLFLVGRRVANKAVALIVSFTIGAVSSAGGTYIGESINTGDWQHPKYKPLLISAGIGAALGMSMSYIGLKKAQRAGMGAVPALTDAPDLSRGLDEDFLNLMRGRSDTIESPHFIDVKLPAVGYGRHMATEDEFIDNVQTNEKLMKIFSGDAAAMRRFYYDFTDIRNRLAKGDLYASESIGRAHRLFDALQPDNAVGGEVGSGDKQLIAENIFVAEPSDEEIIRGKNIASTMETELEKVLPGSMIVNCTVCSSLNYFFTDL